VSRYPVNRRLQLQIIFAFTFIYPILLYAGSGQTTPAQAIFRITTAAVGLIGFVAVSRKPS
jgi:hypothetical protein